MTRRTLLETICQAFCNWHSSMLKVIMWWYSSRLPAFGCQQISSGHGSTLDSSGSLKRMCNSSQGWAGTFLEGENIKILSTQVSERLAKTTLYSGNGIPPIGIHSSFAKEKAKFRYSMMLVAMSLTIEQLSWPWVWGLELNWVMPFLGITFSLDILFLVQSISISENKLLRTETQ